MGTLQKVTSSFLGGAVKDASFVRKRITLLVTVLLLSSLVTVLVYQQQILEHVPVSNITFTPFVADLCEVSTAEVWQDSLQSRKDRFLPSPRFGGDHKQSVEGEN